MAVTTVILAQNLMVFSRNVFSRGFLLGCHHLNDTSD